KLPADMVELDDEVKLRDTNVRELAHRFKDEFVSVREDDFQLDPWRRQDWAVYPDTEGANGVGSPDGKHLLTWQMCREWAYADFGLQVLIDNKAIVSCGEYRPETYDLGTSFSKICKVVGPVSRMPYLPRWQDNSHASFIVQSNWGAVAVNGEKDATQFVLV